MRKTLPTAALMLLLSCPAFAGETHLPNSPTQPPPSATVVPLEGTTVDSTLGGETATPDAPGTLTQITLELLAVLPSLL